jgi:predicted DsbA family dithiol-disulfide isomerase
LKALGLEVGLSAESIDEVLHSNVYANEVQHDIDEYNLSVFKVFLSLF